MRGILYDSATAIEVDTSDNVYSTGHFEGTATLDSGAGIFNLSNDSSDALYMLLYW